MNQAHLCIGEVWHRRLRPVCNAFSYKVFFIRLPLRALGQGNFASRWFSRNRFNLLSFHDADHGNGKGSLTEWGDALMRREGIDDADGEIWLQTFPRVLGYVFNPVSFWFFHRKDGSLRAILCAVTNTFGEKHSYLLENGGAMAYGVTLRATKCFHVSPFFDVKGDYSFRFLRAVRGDIESSLARIDYGDAAGALLKTSISGEAHAINDRNVLTAFFGQPLITLGVVVRIHWQALRLWLKKAPFFRKPEPPQHGVSR